MTHETRWVAVGRIQDSIPIVDRLTVGVFAVRIGRAPFQPHLTAATRQQVVVQNEGWLIVQSGKSKAAIEL